MDFSKISMEFGLKRFRRCGTIESFLFFNILRSKPEPFVVEQMKTPPIASPS